MGSRGGKRGAKNRKDYRGPGKSCGAQVKRRRKWLKRFKRK